ncbi:NAC domain-containing protein 86 [Sesamum angolense]|uniref:NAC domain-containing protein 86 n=1 Tax=Sesamum angolense TaxID=2727404 RepID=A0AAE1XDN9_9LAMI|nr:NAC domain-containing protein 86 [Sesamum angolense]
MAPVSLLQVPIDEELVAYYLKRKINGRKIDLEIIPEVDLYKCEPWDLPGKSLLPSKDLEWYFFSPETVNTQRVEDESCNESRYWKATGKDRSPKIGDHYVASASDRSSSIDLHCEGRYDDLDSSDYQMPLTSSPATNMTSSSADARWMQYLSEEAFSFNNPYSNSPPIPYPPSRVDIALECARLQHRFSLPPLEVQDFSQGAFANNDPRMSSHPSVSISKTRINLRTLFKKSFQLLKLLRIFKIRTHGLESITVLSMIFRFSSTVVSQLICDEVFQTGRIVENLRWIGMSDKELEKAFPDDFKTVPIENINSNIHADQFHDFQGETSNHRFNAFTKAADENISIGPHVNDNVSDHNFLDNDGDIDDFSTSPNFEVYEKTEINHGLLVSTRQAPRRSTTREPVGEIRVVFKNMVRNMSMKIMKSQKWEGDGQEHEIPKAVEGGRLCEEVNNIRPYLTFALALCAIWVQVVTPFS